MATKTAARSTVGVFNSSDAELRQVLQLDPRAPVFSMPHGFNMEAPEFAPALGLVPVSADATLRAEAAEFIPMAGSWAVVQAAAEALQLKQKRQIPYATDEEWEARILKREKEVETIKSLQSYRLYVEVFPQDRRGDDDPRTPDPRDRTVSKRMWKWNVEKWRLQLKSRCVYSRAVCLQCREYMLRQHPDDIVETPLPDAAVHRVRLLGEEADGLKAVVVAENEDMREEAGVQAGQLPRKTTLGAGTFQ